MSERRVVVTGGAGFLGSHLTRHARAAGADVVAVTREGQGKGEVAMARLLAEPGLLDGTDVLVHAAAIRHRHGADPASYRASNVDLVEALLRAAQGRVKRFVHVSSVGVYGFPPPAALPITEKTPFAPRTLYSQTREAKLLGFKPGYFSFNTPGGRCEECEGAGQQIVEMQFLSDVTLTCEACKGKRFKSEVLEVKYKGMTIDDVLHLTIDDALEFFADRPEITKRINPLQDVGLGYVRLGQPTTTLSGGELQRIKLAYHLVHERDRHILYLFDEPTIGLHMDDVADLLRTFQRLVEEGHSVMVIEHNLDVIKSADYVLDLGPEGGERGGEIMAEGTPEQIARHRASITGRYLKKVL